MPTSNTIMLLTAQVYDIPMETQFTEGPLVDYVSLGSCLTKSSEFTNDISS